MGPSQNPPTDNPQRTPSPHPRLSEAYADGAQRQGQGQVSASLPVIQGRFGQGEEASRGSPQPRGSLRGIPTGVPGGVPGGVQGVALGGASGGVPGGGVQGGVSRGVRESANGHARKGVSGRAAAAVSERGGSRQPEVSGGLVGQLLRSSPSGHFGGITRSVVKEVAHTAQNRPPIFRFETAMSRVRS